MHRTPLLSVLLLALLAATASAQSVAVWQPGNGPTGRPLVTPVVPDGAFVASRAELRAQLAERRALNLARFVAYREAGQFPQNHVQPGMLNVFIDDAGKICAAANLMAQDGMLAQVRAQAAADNYLKLVTLTDGPLYRWMLSSGFTQAEIDMIQEPYFYMDDELEPPPPQVEDAEVRRLQARFREIEQTLIRNADRSLDAAVDALVAYRSTHGIAPLATIQAHGDALPTPPPVIQPVYVQPVHVQPTPVPTPVYVSAAVRDPLVWAPHMGRRNFN